MWIYTLEDAVAGSTSGGCCCWLKSPTETFHGMEDHYRLPLKTTTVGGSGANSCIALHYSVVTLPWVCCLILKINNLIQILC